MEMRKEWAMSFEEEGEKLGSRKKIKEAAGNEIEKSTGAGFAELAENWSRSEKGQRQKFRVVLRKD